MKKRTFAILLLAAVVFIWGHSLIPIADSSDESMSIMRIMQWVLDHLHIPLTLTEHFVRKLAHFTEHAAAGAVLWLYFVPAGAFSGVLKSGGTEAFHGIISIIKKPLLIGFFIGFADETIQMFSGRGAAIADVWIDFAGVCAGSLLIHLLRILVNRVSLRRKQRAKGV